MAQPGASEADLGRTVVGVVVVTHRARRSICAAARRPAGLAAGGRACSWSTPPRRTARSRKPRLGQSETLVVARSAFVHGLTREQARQRLGTPVRVMLTPTPTRSSPTSGALTAPVREGAAAVAYGRQLARAGAGIVEQVGRLFSYPAESHVRSLADWPRYGSYTHFCSNACAAWSSKALDTIGGFKPTLVSEETIAVAELLAQGHSIAYVAEATVEHSHPQSLSTAFRRQFDIGYSRRLYDWLLIQRERDEVRGRAFAREVLERARRAGPLATGASLALLASAWLGYRAGLAGPRLPLALARHLSGQDYFWTSDLLRGGSGALAPV
ncbi:MAG: glycosyltransferase family 2 protein [Geminicoccaceae bacterium]